MHYVLQLLIYYRIDVMVGYVRSTPLPPGGGGVRLVLQNQQATWSENYVTPNQARSL